MASSPKPASSSSSSSSSSASSSASSLAEADEADEQMAQFWKTQNDLIDDIDPMHADWKLHALPLARIKKVMKLDDSNIKFISADGPLVFAKACEILILELTLRAWNFTANSKRRTLQRNDVALAVADCDMFDFLIDIVPRPEGGQRGGGRGGAGGGRGAGANGADGGPASPENHMQEYMKLLTQQQQFFFGGGASVGGVAGDDGGGGGGELGMGDDDDDGGGGGGGGSGGAASVVSAVGSALEAGDGGEDDASGINMQQYYQQVMQMFAQSPAR